MLRCTCITRSGMGITIEGLSAQVQELMTWKAKAEGERISDLYKYGSSAVAVVAAAFIGTSHMDSRINHTKEDLRDRIASSESQLSGRLAMIEKSLEKTMTLMEKRLEDRIVAMEHAIVGKLELSGRVERLESKK